LKKPLLWNTVQEAADWLTKYTNEDWTTNRVLSRWVELCPESVNVIINNQNDLLKLVNGKWVKLPQDTPPKSIMLQVIMSADQFLDDMLKFGKVLPFELADILGQLYRLENPISFLALRLSINEVDKLIEPPSAFEKLVSELRIDPKKYDTTATLNEKDAHSADPTNGFIEESEKQQNDKPEGVLNFV
jgi:hypothetical protein